jgi:hypothetical protein
VIFRIAGPDGSVFDPLPDLSEIVFETLLSDLSLTPAFFAASMTLRPFDGKVDGFSQKTCFPALPPRWRYPHGNPSKITRGPVDLRSAISSCIAVTV